MSKILTFVQKPNNQSLAGKQDGETGHGYEAFPVLRLIHLLPHNERQPGLNDECCRIHTCNHYGAFLVVMTTDLLSPSESIMKSAMLCQDAVTMMETYAKQTPARAALVPIK